MDNVLVSNVANKNVFATALFLFIVLKLVSHIDRVKEENKENRLLHQEYRGISLNVHNLRCRCDCWVDPVSINSRYERYLHPAT